MKKIKYIQIKYVVEDINIKDVNSNIGSSTATTPEEIQSEEVDLFVDITFDDIDLADLEDILVYMDKIMEHVKKKRKIEAADLEGNGDNDTNDAALSDSS